MTMLGVTFETTVNLGAVLVLIFGMAMALIFTIRARSSATWKDNYEAAHQRAEDLAIRVTEEREKKHDLANKVATLELTRDLSPVLAAMKDLAAEMVAMRREDENRYQSAIAEVREMFLDHERKGQERHEALLRLTEQIVDKLNGKEA